MQNLVKGQAKEKEIKSILPTMHPLNVWSSKVLKVGEDLLLPSLPTYPLRIVVKHARRIKIHTADECLGVGFWCLKMVCSLKVP